MKYKLPRPKLTQKNIKSIIERELDRQEVPLDSLSQKKLKALFEVCKVIKEKGLPDHLVLKKVSKEIGHGIFLHPDSDPIKRGQVIASYSGEVSIDPQNQEDDSAYAFSMLADMKLTKEEQKRLDKDRAFAPTRLYALNLDANTKGNFTRFINHSVKPNVEAMMYEVEENKYGLETMPIEVIYVAKRTINPGEQLLVCYEDEEKSYWSAFGVDPIKMDPKTYRIDSKLKII